MMIVTVSTLSDLLIISCFNDLSIWEKIVFNDQNLWLAFFTPLDGSRCNMTFFWSREFSKFALSIYLRAGKTSFEN